MPGNRSQQATRTTASARRSSNSTLIETSLANFEHMTKTSACLTHAWNRLAGIEEMITKLNNDDTGEAEAEDDAETADSRVMFEEWKRETLATGQGAPISSLLKTLAEIGIKDIEALLKTFGTSENFPVDSPDVLTLRREILDGLESGASDHSGRILLSETSSNRYRAITGTADEHDPFWERLRSTRSMRKWNNVFKEEKQADEVMACTCSSRDASTASGAGKDQGTVVASVKD